MRPEDVDGGWPTDPLSWSEIRELDASGRVDIESHTVHHWDLTTLDAATMTAELVDAKTAIQQELGGKQVNFLAYPYGASDAAVDMAMWQAGYTAGLRVDDAVEPTCANKFELQRVQMDANTSVNLGQSGWYEFFMSKIGDSDVDIPNLSVTGIQYLDPVSKSPIDLAHVQPGQTVLIKVNVNNAAAPAGVIATLAIDSDSNHSNGTIYNSHGTTPNQDIQVRCPWGPSSFQWTWTVPSDAPVSQYYVNVTFNDPQYVLVFKNSDWRSAFVVVPSAPLSPSLAGAAPQTASTSGDTASASAHDAVVAEEVPHWANVIVQSPTATQWPVARENLAQSVQAAKAANDSETLSTSVTALNDAVLADGTRWPWLGWAGPYAL